MIRGALREIFSSLRLRLQPLLLLLLLLPPSSSKIHTSSSRGLATTRSVLAFGGLRTVNREVPGTTARAAEWLQQPPSTLWAPQRSTASECSKSSRCCCMRSSSEASAAALPSANSPQEPPFRLLGGGLSLNPSLIFALAARRLLQRELQQLFQPSEVAASAQAHSAVSAVASDAVCTPVTVEGGSGGDGSIAFLRLKAAPRSGASGGSGGRGGCVLLRAVGASEEAPSVPRRLSAVGESGSWRAASGGIGTGQGKTGVRWSALWCLLLPPLATKLLLWMFLVLRLQLLGLRGAASVAGLLAPCVAAGNNYCCCSTCTGVFAGTSYRVENDASFLASGPWP